MAPDIYLALAFHNHQPVGNFGWVFQEAFERAYLPMVQCLEQHPNIRVALHYTGPLRDWLQENQPDFFPRLRPMVECRQVEIMCGGYYEPVLVSLPDADKLGQIHKQIEAVRQDFDHDPIGLWLAERIWEPHLPSTLAQTGIKYTIVDDTHFKAIGYDDEDLFGYYVTEEQGHTIKIFATSMALRYAIPWKTVDDIIRWLREQATDPGLAGRYMGRTKVAVMGDDGEKFGLWPGTFAHVWQSGWMDRFFTALEENSDWVRTITPADAAQGFPALGRAYLPTASYDEMGEWAMPPDPAWDLLHLKHELEQEGRTHITRYMKGSLWRNFMVKYQEVNQLHKKALWVSKKVHAMRAGKRKASALDHLWAGQCNCAYWHGTFGGIYLFHIREADYRHLIMAENLADGLDKKKPDDGFLHVDVTDFDSDASDDIVITSDQMALVFDLDQGGSLVEWDYRPAACNVLNVMTRRREGYHRDLVSAAAAGTVITPDMPSLGDRPDQTHSQAVRVREPGLHERLLYDWYRRGSLLDHFLGESSTLDDFYRCQYEELGDFVNQPYTFETKPDRTDDIMLTLRRDGHIWQGAVRLPITVEKTISVRPNTPTLTIVYKLTNSESGALSARFGVETNIGLSGGNGEQTYLSTGFARYPFGEIATNDETETLTITSDLKELEITLQIDRRSTLWRFPLETISASEGGFERNYQGTSLLLWWPLKLAPGQGWSVQLSFSLTQL